MRCRRSIGNSHDGDLCPADHTWPGTLDVVPPGTRLEACRAHQKISMISVIFPQEVVDTPRAIAVSPIISICQRVCTVSCGAVGINDLVK